MRRAAARVAAVMNDIAGWVFILCAAFITIDVLLRNFAGFSSSATTEITNYMLAFGIAWGLAHALARASCARAMPRKSTGSWARAALRRRRRRRSRL
jgi:TRAP-type mannitol/chloroaromatic compound transport system permease small subunit